MNESTLTPDGSILFDGIGKLSEEGAFDLGKMPFEPVYILRNATEFEIKQLEEVEAGILEGYMVEVK